MSQINRNYLHSRPSGEFHSLQSSQSPRLESATQPSMQLLAMPSRITLAENPTLAKEIQELIDRSRQSPAEAVTIENGLSTMHTLPSNDEYVPRDWSLEDARRALAFEKTFKLLLIRFDDSPITEMSVRQLSSCIRNVFVPEPIVPRYCYVEVDSYNDCDKLISSSPQYTVTPANKLKHVHQPTEINPYAITVIHIPDHISLDYIRSQFIGCVHYKEEYNIDNNYHSARRVHFYFKNAIHSTRAYKRAFELQLGLNCIVCFRRRIFSANGGHTDPAASVEISSSPDLEGLPSSANRTSEQGRKRTAGLASPEPEAVRIKTEMLSEHILPPDAVDMNDLIDDEDSVQEPSTPEFSPASRPNYHNNFEVQCKNEPVEVIDLTAADICPAVPGRTKDNIKHEPQINLLGTQLVIPDVEEVFGYSDSSDSNAGSNDVDSDFDTGLDNEENVFLTKRTSNAIEATDEDEHLTVKNEPAIAPQPMNPNEKYNGDPELEEFVVDFLK